MVRDYIEKLIGSYGEISEEEQLQEIVKKASEEFEQPIDLHYVGDYDSPGYTINYYVIVWVDGGKAEVLTTEIEWY